MYNPGIVNNLIQIAHAWESGLNVRIDDGVLDNTCGMMDLSHKMLCEIKVYGTELQGKLYEVVIK